MARVLGAEGYGEFNLAVSFSGYFGIIATFGFLAYISREITRHENIAPYVNIAFTLRVFFSLISFILFVIIIYHYKNTNKIFLLSMIMGVVMILSSLDMRFVFVSKNQHWKASIWGLTGQIVYAGLLFIFITKPDQLVFYAMIQSSIVLVPSIISFYIYVKEIGKISFTFNYLNWRELKKESFSIGLSNITGQINAYFAGMIIGLTLSTAELGYYSVGFKLMLLFNIIFNLIATVITPTISQLVVQNRDKLLKVLKIYFFACLLVGILSALFLFSVADIVVDKLFGTEYENSKILIKIWALGLLPLTPLAIFFASSLVPCNASKERLITGAVGSVISLISIPVLIHLGGISAVPFSHILSELSITCLGAYYLIRKLKLSRMELFNIFNIKSSYIDLRNIIITRKI